MRRVCVCVCVPQHQTMEKQLEKKTAERKAQKHKIQVRLARAAPLWIGSRSQAGGEVASTSQQSEGEQGWALLVGMHASCGNSACKRLALLQEWLDEFKRVNGRDASKEDKEHVRPMFNRYVRCG
jgi:hypothetical protein